MQLRVLLIDDSPDDVELIVRELRRGGFEPYWRRVDTGEDLDQALAEPWDVVTCDFAMPRFTAMAALAMLRSRDRDVPIIVVSGEVGEQVAVSAMKAGAHDFVSKHRLARLVPAVERECREAAERRARRQAEQALRESQERYRMLVEMSHDLIWSVDAQGRPTFVNHATRAMLGYEPDEVVGRPFQDFMRPAEAERTTQFLADQRGGADGFQYEVELRGKTGQPVIISANCRVVRGPHGEFAGSIGTATDITARRRAEEALAASEQRYRALVDSAHDVVWEVDAAGRATFINRAVTDVLGYTPEEIIGRPFKDFMRPEEGARGMCFFEQIRGVTRWLGYEAELLRRDGTPVVLYANITPLFDRTGAFAGTTGIAIDVTERRRAEDLLRASAERLQLALRAAHMGVCEWDAATDTVTCSAELGPVLGLPAEQRQVSRETFLDAVHPSDRERLRAAIEHATQEHAECTIDIQILWPDGTSRWVAIHGSTIHQGVDCPKRMVAVLRDITARKHAETDRARLLAAVEHIPEALMITDGGGTIVYVNAAFEHMTGYRRSELCGQRPDFLRDQAREDHARAVLAGGQTWRGTVQQRRRDGSSYVAEVSVTPVPNADGDIIYVTLALDRTRVAA